mgnify:CR=1 FL=1
MPNSYFLKNLRLLNVPKQAVKTDAEINSAGRIANLASPPILGASAEFILLRQLLRGQGRCYKQLIIVLVINRIIIELRLKLILPLK